MRTPGHASGPIDSDHIGIDSDPTDLRSNDVPKNCGPGISFAPPDGRPSGSRRNGLSSSTCRSAAGRGPGSSQRVGESFGRSFLKCLNEFGDGIIPVCFPVRIRVKQLVRHHVERSIHNLQCENMFLSKREQFDATYLLAPGPCGPVSKH